MKVRAPLKPSQISGPDLREPVSSFDTCLCVERHQTGSEELRPSPLKKLSPLIAMTSRYHRNFLLKDHEVYRPKWKVAFSVCTVVYKIAGLHEIAGQGVKGII
jgi:hypothetical protein